MKKEETLQAKAARRETCARWPEFLKILATRAESPLREDQFCAKHGFEKTYFNRMKTGAITPKWDKIRAVHAAFIAEGVMDAEPAA